MRVLIVEDEEYLADALQAGLGKEGIAVDTVLDGQGALGMLAVNDYDTVVLDRDLPGVHGDDVCTTIVRTYPSTRVLMLTAATQLNEKVAGFELGADDYLTKPFAFEELIARLHALARRPASSHPPLMAFADIQLDSFRREAYRRGRYLRLTRKQFAVLELLMRAQGGVVSQETLLEKIWDENANPFTTAPRVTISTLRKVLGAPDLIRTVHGSGYRLVDPHA